MSDLANIHYLYPRHLPARDYAEPLESLLEAACRDAAMKSGRTDLDLRISLLIEGALPDEDRSAVLAAVPILVGNAIEHGFYGYSHGEIGVRLICGPSIDTQLEVADNGWSFGARTDAASSDNGLRLLSTFGEVSQTSEPIAPGCRLNKIHLLLPRLRPVGNG